MGLVKYLLDTSIVIESIRLNKFEAGEYLRKKYSGKLYLSQITVGELFSGASAQDKETDLFLKSLLKEFNIIEPSVESSILAGRLRYFYKVSMADAFIASDAIQNGLVLATLNKKDFVKIKGLKISD